uniref:uncharacterized protein LOC120956283 n=1 Tax=Anopheles coluzzii TaxID=1518534 RepID=UPI0020FFA206|nr:uncharacterized protein LOC120956283 [Anopheles coluzzii]
MLTYRAWLLLALLGAQCALILGAPATGHGYDTKSFAQAYLECLRYLNISRQSLYAYDSAAVPLNCGSNCLLRCIGLNARWWHDETGLSERALVRFFRQAPADSLLQARACVAELPAPPADSCAGAYWSFRCYSDALGELIAHPAYVAPCGQEIRRAVSDCATMLQVEDGQLQTCVRTETFLRQGNGAALLRCVVLRLGLYADSTGVLCDRVRLLMDADTAEQWTVARAEEAKRCEEDLRALGADTCVVAAHAVELCYGWPAFGELWEVLKQEYGSSDDALAEESEQVVVVGASSSTEEPQEAEPNEITAAEEDVEVFKYPSSPRFRGLVIVAPELYAVDATVEDGSKSSEGSSSQDEEEQLPKDVKPTQLELADGQEPVTTTNGNTVKQSAASTVCDFTFKTCAMVNYMLQYTMSRLRNRWRRNRKQPILFRHVRCLNTSWMGLYVSAQVFLRSSKCEQRAFIIFQTSSSSDSHAPSQS